MNPLSPGQELGGRYRILGSLAEGGMGRIFRAMDLRLEREVALKVVAGIREQDPDALARFEREAKVLATLHHPAILTVHDFLNEGGVQVIVTELLEGETLEARLARGPLDLDEALAMAIHLAEGLAAAHEQGFIHRDLKPANVFLTDQGEAKLLDFGLARLEAEAEQGPAVAPPPSVRDSGPHRRTTGRTHPSLPKLNTEVGLILGTLDYMSPEQCLGRPLDARSDVFSFGTLLLESLTGFHPFPGEHRLEVMDTLLTKAPKGLDDPALPKELKGILSRTLAKDRDLRTPSAGALLAELRGFQRARERRPLLRRIRWAAAVLALAGAGLGAWQWTRVTRAPVDSLVVLPLAVDAGSQDLAYLAEGVAEQLRSNLSRVPGLRVLGRATSQRFQGGLPDPVSAGRALGVGAVFTGRIVRLDGKVLLKAELTKVRDGSQIWGEQYLRETSDFLGLQQQISREITQRLRDKLDGQVIRGLERRGTRNPEAFEAYLRGRAEWNTRTGEGIQKARRHYEEALEKDPTYPGAWSALGELDLLRDDGPKAKEEARKALELDPAMGEAHAVLGLVAFLHDWNVARSEAEFKEALTTVPGNATAHHWYGLVLGSVGRVVEARLEFAKALSLEPDSLGIQCDAVLPDLQESRLKEAETRLRGILERHPGHERALKYLAIALLLQHRFEEAATEAERAMRSADDAYALGLLGYCQGRVGRLEALSLTRARLMALERKGLRISYWQALLSLGTGDHAGALDWLERSRAEHSELLIVGIGSPLWEPLRGEPRFQSLLAAVGLDSATYKGLARNGR